MEIFQDGDLLSLLKNNVFIPTLEEKLDICKQLSAGLLHLHSEKVIHCDIACRYESSINIYKNRSVIEKIKKKK